MTASLENAFDEHWLHGVEHMTADHSGYIYWKGQNVEHYNCPYDLSNAEQVQNLASRCLHIESLGITPSTGTAIWRWPWMKELTAEHQWLDFFKHAPDLWEGNDALVVVMEKDRVAFFFKGNVEYFNGIEDFLDSRGVEYDPEEITYHKFASAGFGIPQAGQNEHNGIIYAPLTGIISLLEKYQVPSDLYQSGVPDLQEDTKVN